MATSKVFLHVFNVVFSILGLAIAAVSIWFFIQINEFTSLRNSNHYLLDYNVYWPQAIPWLFFLLGIFIFFVSCCGISGAAKNNKSLLLTYVIFVGTFIALLLATAVIALVFADKQATDDFIRDSVWDAFNQVKAEMTEARRREGGNTAEQFGYLEKKLHCCGSESPRDYRSFRDNLPQSCCDVFYKGWLDEYPIDCAFTNKMANERHGCSTVAVWYTRITIKILSGAAIFTAFIGGISLFAALSLLKGLKRKPVKLSAKYESDSKKVLI